MNETRETLIRTTEMSKVVSLKDMLRDGMTIAISGIDSSYYPKRLIQAIKESGVKNLTLMYIENNAELDPEGDPMDLIINGQVSKLITSHLGYLAKNWKDYLEEVELLPMDVLAFKMQAGANRLPGVVFKKEYVDLYRDGKMAKRHPSFKFQGQEYVMEPALNADLGIIVADHYDSETGNCKWNGTNYNCADVARLSDACFVEYLNNWVPDFDQVDLPGQYVTDGVQCLCVTESKDIKGNTVNVYRKTNWEE